MYVSPEQIAKAKSIDLFTYLNNFEPEQLKKISRNCYCTKEHDSLKISVDTGLWHWFSHRIGGKTALDYLIKVQGYPFVEAVLKLNDLNFQNIKIREPTFSKSQYDLLLPKPYENNNRVLHYLTNIRKIDREIVDYFISIGQIYEESIHHNAVFIGLDQSRKAKYAYTRGIGKERFHSELEGSDKRFSFSFTSGNMTVNSLHIFESAIDLLSYATLIKLQGKDWQSANYLSLGGIFSTGKQETLPLNLNHYLHNHLCINTIHLHLDNDDVGREVTNFLKKKLLLAYNVFDKSPKAKDVNDQLRNHYKNDVLLTR